jgi:hypothetical protein
MERTRKIAHTHCLMALSPDAIKAVASLLERLSRKIWHLLNSSPRAGLHSPINELGLNIPTIWEDICITAVRSWTQILNDEGSLGIAALAYLRGGGR